MEILKIPAHAFPHDFRHLAGTADSRCEICSEVSFVRNRDHFPEGGLLASVVESPFWGIPVCSSIRIDEYPEPRTWLYIHDHRRYFFDL
jgi:hypothetical protein